MIKRAFLVFLASMSLVWAGGLFADEHWIPGIVLSALAGVALGFRDEAVRKAEREAIRRGAWLR